MTRKPAVGFIVNPIAGMGGRVGLKGTDGDALARALERGAVPLSSARAVRCLLEFADRKDALTLYTGPGSMGEEAALSLGFEPVILGEPVEGGHTSSRDTVELANRMAEKNVDLILFAGGDGTARDVCSAIGERVLALGIPAGVKIHSAAFASSPSAAGVLVSHLIDRGLGRVSEKMAEVMDIDEEAYRRGELRARLYGYLRVPYERGRMQNLKSGSPASEAEAQVAIGHAAMEIVLAEPETLFLIGAGTTTRALTRALGVNGTLLGVDAWLGGPGGLGKGLVATDIAEREILTLLEGHPQVKQVKIVVTPIGGQGFVFGRGNQQFSPEVIRRIAGQNKQNIIILSTPSKIAALEGRPMLVDSGDSGLDRSLEGYYKIVTGFRQFTMYQVSQG